MKVTFFSSMTNKDALLKRCDKFFQFDVKFFDLSKKEEMIQNAADTDILIVDAMGTVSKDIIDALKNLKLIQSEGVGYQGFDVEYAKEKGILVTNNKKINDTAVAEHTVMLILSVLKEQNLGSKAVYDGNQLKAKSNAFGRIRELSQCTVGLIGLGDIGKMTAKMLSSFGCKILYSNRTRYENEEKEYGISYCTQEELLHQSDIVSLHLASTDETNKTVNKSFLDSMKDGAILINTSRGELVDNDALYNALNSGKLAGAGLDVISPEPVTSDNILLSKDIKDRLTLTPHIAGITSKTIDKAYNNLYNNTLKIQNGEKPSNIVWE